MEKQFSGTFPSPGSPLSSEDGRAVRYPKGWYSERMPHSSNYARKGFNNIPSAAMMPFSSGRALPSKWDDAERWISSPISVGNVTNNSNYYYGPSFNKNAYLAHNFKKRAKSKSGPLGNGSLGLGLNGSYNNNNTFSPVLGVGVVNGGKWRQSLTVESRVDVGVGSEVLDGGGGGGGDISRRRSYTGHDPEWLDLWSCPMTPSKDKHDLNLANECFESINDNDNNNNEEDNGWKNEAKVDRVISRRDMATQMYPESGSSSPCANSPSPLLSNNNNNNNGPNLNVQSQEFIVKDVQIDRQTSITTQSSILKGNNNEDFENCSILDEDNKKFKLRREEAKINAWENLQKIKAESAIQRLEVKLEKKRESSTKKIMEKLRQAELKAQKMRSLLSDDNVTLFKKSSKIHSFCRKFQFSSTCYRS